MTAPAIALPDISWFQDPGLTELTPLTVEDSGRIYGHLCGWGRAHRGLSGRITPPRSHTDYSEFLLHAVRVQDGDKVRRIAVGNITMSTGHAAMSANLRQAVEHYDNTGSIIAQVTVGEDMHGVWFSGAVLPDADPFTVRRLESSGTSGDWRALPGGKGLELCAVLACPVPGFSAPRARVASGAPLALVAAGALRPRAAAFGRRVDPTWRRPQLAATPRVSFTPADLAAQLDAAFDRREERARLCAQKVDLLAAVDDAPARQAALVAALDGTAERQAALLAELTDDGDAFDVSGMPPALLKEWLPGGKVGDRIAWGTPHAMTRCLDEAKRHNIPERQRGGMCQNIRSIAEPGG